LCSLVAVSEEFDGRDEKKLDVMGRSERWLGENEWAVKSDH
jgi:hypothetical protein